MKQYTSGKTRPSNWQQYETEVTPGLSQTSASELEALLSDHIRDLSTGPGWVRFTSDEFASALSSRTVSSIYILLRYDVPRPKALLGHEHFTRLISSIQQVFELSDHRAFASFQISAAGSNTSVMRRLKTEIEAATGLRATDDTGDLLLRIRRTKSGWDVLIRITPRPLSLRPWRVCDMQGALNGPTAAAIIQLLGPKAGANAINIACGSGTLAIEHALIQPDVKIVACDIDPDALACAAENVSAAGVRGHVKLIHGDARALPLDDQSIDTLYADLPFGQLVGSHTDNQALYPAVLHEAARIARPNARLAIITHEIRLMSTVLAQQSAWQLENEYPITLRGLHPRIYILRKQP